MEKNKIALITYSLSSGGLERVVANSTFLFHEMGYEVYLYVLNSKIDYPFTGELHHYSIDKLSFFSKINAYYKIYKSLKVNDFSLVIDHRYRLNWLTEILWQKIIYKHQKVINYIHSSKIHNYLFQSINFNRFLFRNTLFVCVSHGIQKKVNSKYPFLKAKTIYNFINFKKSKEHSNKSEKYIVAIARMDYENVKQVDVLLECYGKSMLPQQNIGLIILGDGLRFNEMKSFAKELKIFNLVDFKGFVSDPTSYLKNALFTVLTSKYEGLPTVLVESLMLETPVISFDCPTGPNEIIIDSWNGLLIENQNKSKMIEGMNKMITNEELYRTLKKNATVSVEKFQLESISNQWKKLINDIL